MRPPTASGRLRTSGSVLALALIASGCAASPPAVTPASSGGEAAESACSTASFDALARRLRDYYCETVEGSIVSSEIESCDDIEVTLRAPADRGAGLDARVLELATATGHVFLLMACTSERTEAFLLEDLWSTTDEEATTRSDGSVERFEAVDVVPGGASELRIDVAFSRSREVWHGCVRERQRDERTILCEAAASGSRCADVPTLRSDHAECDELCLIRQLAEDEPTCEDEGAASYDRELRLGLDLTDGRVRVSRMPVTAPTVDLGWPPGLVGDHTFEALLAIRPLEPLDLTLLGD